MKRLLVLALLALCGCSNRLTFENLVKLHAHQTYDEVVAVIGKPDQLTLTSEGTEKLILAARWGHYPQRDGFPGIFVGFADGEVDRICVTGIDAPR